MRATLWNSTGGIFYLSKALRFRRKLWAPFVDAIAGPLREWVRAAQAGGARRLWIFGPNAGWTLPRDLGFSEIIAVEPDPLAYWMFWWRFARAGVKVTHWPDSPLTREPADLRRWIDTQLRAGDAVLFSNLLGQWSLQFNEAQEARQNAFRPLIGEIFRRVPTVTYHDRLSGAMALTALPVAQDGFATNDAWITGMHRQLHAADVELCDHGLESFFSEVRSTAATTAVIKNYSWEISPGIFHWVELISSFKK